MLLGMDEPYLHPAFEELREKPQKRRGGTAHLDVQVFDVRRTDPQRPFDCRHLGKHLVVVRYVGNEFCCHGMKGCGCKGRLFVWQEIPI